MHWSDERHPLWSWLLATCALATALPLWTAAHLPFTDLPQHVAAIGTLRHWWDPEWRAQQYFTLAFGQTQYLLYYLVGAALAFPFATAERANLVLLSLTALSFPYALRSLLRSLRLDERLSLFACPLFWSQALLIGFFNYVAAMPLVLWGLALAVRNAEKQTRRTLLLLAACSAALFYLHLSAFVFFAPAAALASIVLPERAPLRDWPRRLLWALPVFGLALLWLWTSPVVHPQAVGWTQPMSIELEPPAISLRNLPDALLDIWRGSEDEYALLGLLVAAAALAWPRRREPDARATSRSLVAAWALLAAILYLAFPNSIGWMWQLNERYALAFALLVPALLRPAAGVRGAAPLLLAAATAIFTAGAAFTNIHAFEGEVGPFDAVLSRADSGRRLIGLIYEQNSRFAKFSAFLHFGSYYRARKGGVASFSFAELPQSPLRYRPESEPPRHPPGWEWHPNVFRNQVDGEYYDYVLVHGLVDPFAYRPPGPSWGVVAREGRWTLYEKLR